MKARSTKLAVEALEDRCVPSTVAYGDFNKDGLMDMAAITAPTTVTVSLANPDGSYTVSAKLTVPKSQQISNIEVADFNHDGKLDIVAQSYSDKSLYGSIWYGDGDGTFGSRTTSDGWKNNHHGSMF